jgi:hypothetical protein
VACQLQSAGSRRRSLKKRFKSCSGFAAEAASESLFRAPRERSTQPLSATTALRSSRESLSRSLRITFPAKTSSTEAFSSSTCYQSSCFNSCLGRPLTQGPVRRSSIPSSRFSIAYFEGFREDQNGPSEVVYRICQSGSNVI